MGQRLTFIEGRLFSALPTQNALLRRGINDSQLFLSLFY
jgi:hypothetical protein